MSSRSASVEPSSEKLLPFFLAWIDLLRKSSASPHGLNRALGLHQWFCLLRRPLFSVFDQVYNFVQQEPASVRAPLPRMVCAEIAVPPLFMPLLGGDLSRRFLLLLTTSDAAPECAFGVVYKKCTVDQATSVGLLADRQETLSNSIWTRRSRRQKTTWVHHTCCPSKSDSSRWCSAQKRQSLEAHGLLLGCLERAGIFIIGWLSLLTQKQCLEQRAKAAPLHLAFGASCGALARCS